MLQFGIQNGKQIVLNSAGKPLVLNAMESKQAAYWTKVLNDLGYVVDITTLTQVLARVSEQKFYKVGPAKFMPVLVGQGAWSIDITKYRSFEMGGDFEQGIVNTGADSDRLASVDAGVDSVNVKVRNWIKTFGYTILDVQQASKSGNWDIISSKEKTRKMNWDLGIQRTAFLGTGLGDVGLLNQSTSSFVTLNTALITATLSSMDATAYSAFLAGLIAAYQTNCAYTAMPTHFIIPSDDYNGLAVPSSADFPIKSKLELLLETCRAITMNPNFQVLPCAYAMPANSSSKLTHPRYTLLNYDEDSLAMYIPVDYTSTMGNSVQGIQFQTGAYGQFTGVAVYREKELMYFDNNNG